MREIGASYPKTPDTLGVTLFREMELVPAWRPPPDSLVEIVQAAWRQFEASGRWPDRAYVTAAEWDELGPSAHRARLRIRHEPEDVWIELARWETL